MASRCKTCGSTVDSMGRALPRANADGYVVPSLTVDIAVVRDDDKGGKQVLLIQRGRDPYKGSWAFPGGFVDYNEENAALRELKEETSLVGVKSTVQLISVHGKPERDPRKHIVSIFYKVDVDDHTLVKADDDAANAGWFSISEALNGSPKLAFDHLDLMKNLNKLH